MLVDHTRDLGSLPSVSTVYFHQSLHLKYYNIIMHVTVLKTLYNFYFRKQCKMLVNVQVIILEINLIGKQKRRNWRLIILIYMLKCVFEGDIYLHDIVYQNDVSKTKKEAEKLQKEMKNLKQERDSFKNTLDVREKDLKSSQVTYHLHVLCIITTRRSY